MNRFYVDHILPAASGSRSVEAKSAALTGPLPVSSLLHLALHHLRQQSQLDGQEELLEDESGWKEVHARRHVLVLSPDQAKLRDALADENDLALSEQTVLDAETARLMESIEIKFLPTSAHLTYFLNTIQTEATFRQPASTGAKAAVDTSYLPTAPTLVILHNPSSYLSEAGKANGGSEAYASILCLFISTFTSLSTPSPFLILHDAEASSSTLPVIPLHRLPKSRRPMDATETTAEDVGDKIELNTIAAYFFDVLAEVAAVPMSPSAMVDDSLTHYQIAVTPTRSRPRDEPEPNSIILEYVVESTTSNDGTIPGVRIESVSW